ncbi:MAG: SMI1/KNR4 family protein [Planctomycetaceae bacterium]|nr:SMI1/KNR4 family protein [Planctomycetaceae bacterium]
MEQAHLAQIDRWLAEHRPDYHSLLNPPAQEYLFGAVRSTAGIVLPDGIRRFYEWHDGQEAGTFEPLMMNLTFMTLMEMATTHQMHQHVSMIDQWSEEHWQPSWVPFLSNGGGDYLCVATESFRDIPEGAILWYDHETSEREIIHADFTAFLEDLYDRMISDRLECE